MSRPSERLRRLGRHVASIFTGLAAGPRNFAPRFDHAREAPVGQGEDETEGPRRRTEAAPGREGDEPPRRHADAAPREAATGEAEQAREEAAGRPAAGTPEGATPAADAAPAAAARSEQGSGERANPAAPQDLPEGMSPADVRRGIARESRRPGDGQGVAEPPSRVAAPRHGQVGDLREPGRPGRERSGEDRAAAPCSSATRPGPHGGRRRRSPGSSSRSTGTPSRGSTPWPTCSPSGA